MTPPVTLILSILSALPQEVAAISGAFNTVKSALAAPDQATIGAILAALDTKTDADVAQLDRDIASASGGG
jgi:xanthine dehydrogenase molybdopterin-binding subunit B